MNLSNRVNTFGKLGNFKFTINNINNSLADPSPLTRCSACGDSSSSTSTYSNWWYYLQSNPYYCVDTNNGVLSVNPICNKKLLFKKQEIFTNNPAHETLQLNNVNTLQNILNFNFDKKKDNYIYFNGSMSDRFTPKPSSKFINVPTHGNSKHTSKTNHRPGGSTPNTYGVDIKHGSYDRYLLKKKASNQKQILNNNNNNMPFCFNIK